MQAAMQSGRNAGNTWYPVTREAIGSPAFSWRCLTLDDGTDKLSRKVANYLSTPCNIPQERKSQLHRSGGLRSRIKTVVVFSLQNPNMCLTHFHA